MNEKALEDLAHEIKALRLALERQYGIENGVLTRPEAAEYVKLSLRTLDDRVAEGLIAFHRLGGSPKSPIRFRKRDLDSFLDNCRVPAMNEDPANYSTRPTSRR